LIVDGGKRYLTLSGFHEKREFSRKYYYQGVALG
jgi:hypothetical protein